MQNAIVFFDEFSGWLGAHPTATKSTEDTLQAMLDFAGRDKITGFYTDNAPELLEVGKRVGLIHRTATTGMPQTNGVAERRVKQVKEGTTALLHHAGFTPRWYWPLAMQTSCFAHNVNPYGKLPTPYFKRHGVEFTGINLPFGCLIQFMPVPAKLGNRAPFEPKMRVGLFGGWHVHAGGLWSGDYYAYDLNEFGWDQDAGRYNFVHPQRIKEVVWAPLLE
jgi:hypothetical protein